jgi:hypothetical protein
VLNLFVVMALLGRLGAAHATAVQATGEDRQQECLWAQLLQIIVPIRDHQLTAKQVQCQPVLAEAATFQ